MSINNKHTTPKLTVVGAGPGDVELITLKAIKVLKAADVVLYDALVNDELLDYVNPNAEIIFVGKRRGCYRYQQEQINELIVMTWLKAVATAPLIAISVPTPIAQIIKPIWLSKL